MNNGDNVEKVVEKAENVVPVVAVDLEAEKRGGVKDMAQNAEAIVDEAVKVEEGDNARPAFFVKKASRYMISLDILTSKKDGRIVSVSKTGLGINFKDNFPLLTHTKLDFEFSLPNYEDMTTYRQRSSTYRREAQQVIVDKLSLRNFFLVWHLKDWNITDENGNKIVLNFDPNGSLAEDSLALVYALSPTLLDVVMTGFEKDILLT